MADLISTFVNTGGDNSRILTPDEELDLTTKYFATKDVKLRNKIAAHNLRLVLKIASEYPRNQELVNEGCIGLVKGIEKFDPSRGYKLSTYVSYWIRAHILNFIVNDARLVKLGTTQAQRKLFFNLRKEKAKLEAQGLEVTPEMLAERLVVSEKDVKEMETRLGKDASLDEPVGQDQGDSLSKIDLVTSDAMTPEEALASAEAEEFLQKNLHLFRGGLAENEKVVFESRILQEKTLEEVGDKLNVSRERIRQLESHVLGRFQRFAAAKKLEALL